MLAHLRNLPTAFQRLELHLQLAFAGLAGLVVFALILSLLPKPAPDEQLLEDYGAILAEQLAGLTVESIVKQDKIALNVLAERIANTNAVAGVAVFGVDGQRLAGYGEFAENQAFTFSESVLIGDAYAGYARVVLNPNALLTQNGFNELAPTIAASLVTCITLGMLIVWLTHTPLQKAPLQNAPQTTTQAHPDADPLEQPGVYLLIVNLFNPLDLTSEVRDDIVVECENTINAVANLYGAHWQAIPGTGFALTFAATFAIDSESGGDTTVPASTHQSEQDRAFDAVCAALVLSKLCGRNAPHPLLAPKFRFSLQPIALTRGPLDSMSYSDDFADAVLCSAVADDATIVLSDDFVDSLSQTERLELTSEQNLALAALRTRDDTNYCLLRNATGSLAELIEGQVNSLS